MYLLWVFIGSQDCLRNLWLAWKRRRISGKTSDSRKYVCVFRPIIDSGYRLSHRKYISFRSLPERLLWCYFYDTVFKSALYFILSEIFGLNRPHENLIRKFLHSITIFKRPTHTWIKRFIQSEISCQNESISSQRKLLLAPLQSSFTEVCKVSTSLLQFSRKSGNSRTKTLVEQKPDETLRLACLNEFLKQKEEARKVLKKANMM